MPESAGGDSHGYTTINDIKHYIILILTSLVQRDILIKRYMI